VSLIGTGGAIKNAQNFLDDVFFVLYGDSYLPCHYLEIQQAFMNQSSLGMMTVFKNNNSWDVSNIECSNGKIITYDKTHRSEKMNYIDYGLSVLTKESLAFIPSNQSYDLADFYKTLLNHDQLSAYEVKQRFYEVGSMPGVTELAYHLSQ
jgi:NDP-sugar pyrophosphorylase family protein